MSRQVSELSWDNYSPKEILREFVSDAGGGKTSYGQLRLGGWLRLLMITPLAYLPTALDLHRMDKAINSPLGHQLFLTWATCFGIWFLATIGLVLIGKDESPGKYRLARALTILCLFLEIFTNQINNYALGSVTSHLLLMLVLIIFVYRSLFDYRLGVLALVLCCGIFAGEVFAQMTGWLPAHPYVDVAMSEASFYALREKVVLRMALISFVVAFMLANLTVNQVTRLHRYITESVLQRYLPPTLVERAARGELSLDGEPEKRIVTILFTDLVGFTPLSEELGPERLGKVLNTYLSDVSMLAHEHGATIDKFVGDAVMILFGAPDHLEPEEQARRALDLGREIQRVVQTIDTGTGQPLKARTGINTGEVVVGNFGSPQRSDYTVLGPAVNIAARLESAGRAGQVLVGEDTARLVPGAPLFSAGPMTLKGVPQPVEGFFLDQDPTKDAHS